MKRMMLIMSLGLILSGCVVYPGPYGDAYYYPDTGYYPYAPYAYVWPSFSLSFTDVHRYGYGYGSHFTHDTGFPRHSGGGFGHGHGWGGGMRR